MNTLKVNTNSLYLKCNVMMVCFTCKRKKRRLDSRGAGGGGIQSSQSVESAGESRDRL